MSSIQPVQKPAIQQPVLNHSKLRTCIDSALQAIISVGLMIGSIPQNLYHFAHRIYEMVSDFLNGAYFIFLSLFNQNAALSFAARKENNAYLEQEFLSKYHLYHYPTNYDPEDDDYFCDRLKLQCMIRLHLRTALKTDNLKHAAFVVRHINGPSDPSCKFYCNLDLLAHLIDKKAYPLIDQLFEKGTIQISQRDGAREPILKNLILNHQDVLARKFYEVFSKHDRAHKEELQTFIAKILATDAPRIEAYKTMGILP